MSEQDSARPWARPMPEEQFDLMRRILAAPSPIGLEGAMTQGVLQPFYESFMPEPWGLHTFKGNAGLVLDTHPDEPERPTAMIVGHADKIRLQVRSIGDDGKVWVNSDSFLPTTLLGHEVRLFSEDPARPGHYRVLDGGTLEAVGAIHFAQPALRKGESGIKPEMLYLELQIHGETPKEQVEKLGIRPGDHILLHRPIRHGFSENTFYGAYLDNGLGSFVTAESARLIAQSGGLKNLRVLFAVAAYEEIGRFGSRVLAGELHPDILLGIDVDHDFRAAPGIAEQRQNPQCMGGGFTFTTGSIASEWLNARIEQAARERDIPFQRSPAGRDTGTDAMAAVLASVDAAAASLGIPIRNMHTISETGHTGDVLACLHAVTATLQALDGMNEGRGVTREDLRTGHPRLDEAESLRPTPCRTRTSL